MKLAEKVALITGAANGIGEAIALLFAREGAKVVIADIDVEHGNAVAEKIRKEGGDALFQRCDTGSQADVTATLDATVRQYGTVDIVVNNAALMLPDSILECSTEDFQRVLNANLTGTFMFTRDAAKIMISRNKGGVIINFSSTLAVVGSPRSIAYHASKGGIASFTRAAAIALMPHNIRVNAVAPGTTDTPGLRAGAAACGDVEKGLKLIAAEQPIKRLARPEEIANVALFLACEDASFVHGATWLVDGGFTII